MPERIENVDDSFQVGDKDTLLRFGKKRYRRVKIVC